MSHNTARGTGPLSNDLQTALRERIRERGVRAAAAELGVPRYAVLQGASGGDVHVCTAIVLEQRLGATTAPAARDGGSEAERGISLKDG